MITLLFLVKHSDVCLKAIIASVRILPTSINITVIFTFFNDFFVTSYNQANCSDREAFTGVRGFVNLEKPGSKKWHMSC